MITSRVNPKIKLVRSLAQRKNRRETGLFIAEGIHHVGAALDANAPIERILYAPELLTSDFGQHLVTAAEQNNVDCIAVSAEVFTYLADKQNPAGLLAVINQDPTPLSSQPEFDWGVALVTPQDPGNLGTILRTLDAVGASGLILLDGGVDPFHPTAVRASMGAIFSMPMYTASVDEFAAWAVAQAVEVVGTSANADAVFTDFKPHAKSVLLMGPERTGLSAEQLEMCTSTLSLPMLGQVTSLNLSVATGVLLYHYQTHYASLS